MRIVNIVIVYNLDRSKVLMLLRQKDPYIGLYNFPGGKIEGQESILDSCYRELQEETGIAPSQISLRHTMTFDYHFLNYSLAIAVGEIDDQVPLVAERHPLKWISTSANFQDRQSFAGDGNIQHILDVLNYSEFNF
ncbi:MAG TPA: NUDIX domain-containing protein [Erysipelothrix sp.]|nr:NUDIX domain-containing protein [Erysipelothrix sp.]